MPVIIDISVLGTNAIEEDIASLKNLEKKVSKRFSTSIQKPRKGQKSANISTLFTTLKNTFPSATKTTTNAVSTLVVEKKGKMVGTIAIKEGTTPESVLNNFVIGNANYIVLQYPELSKTKGLLIRPKLGDLKAIKDTRTKNSWNIHLTDTAVRRYRKELEQTIYSTLLKEVDSIVNKKITSGIRLNIAARLGVAADSITVTPKGGRAGLDISELVRKEMKSRMGKGRSDLKLNYRTGEFVDSVKVKVKTNDVIAYSFDEKHYGIHEEAQGNSPKGSNFTRIHAKNGKVLSFINLKTGRRQFAKFVDIRERPVIKQSIRAVALKLFNDKFRLEKV